MAPDAHNKYFLESHCQMTCKFFDCVIEQWIREEILGSMPAAEVDYVILMNINVVVD